VLDSEGVVHPQAELLGVRGQATAVDGSRSRQQQSRPGLTSGGTDVGPLVGPEIRPLPGSEVGPLVGPEVGSEIGPLVEPEVGPDVGPRIGPAVRPLVGPNVGRDDDWDVGPVAGPEKDHC
jgi:hypothetical protein